MKARIFHDEGEEMILVPLLMQKRNFDALVRAEDNDQIGGIPVGSISILYDEGAAEPIARLLVNSDPELKAIQRMHGFVGGATEVFNPELDNSPRDD